MDDLSLLIYKRENVLERIDVGNNKVSRKEYAQIG